MLLLFALALAAPPLEGLRQGTLDAGTARLRMLVAIDKAGDSYRGSVTSVDQSPMPFVFDSVTFVEGKVTCSAKSIGGVLEGLLLADGSIAGTWTQKGTTLPLILEALHRAQEPKPPFPYAELEVTFPSAQKGVTLSGTLTVPKGAGPFAAVVMITGSGPQDRNETILGHKPFMVLADAMTRAGVAVLRYDDRGIGKSTGAFAEATTLDFAEDTKGAVAFLKTRKEVDGKRIGLLGHSEGALIAPMVPAAFYVLVAPPAIRGDELIVSQVRVMGGDVELQRKALAWAKTKDDKPDPALKDLPQAELKKLRSPWFRYFSSYDPAPALRALTAPTLAVFGEKDTQVQPAVNKAPFEAACKGAKVVVLPGLNHLMQTAKTGSLLEYGQLDETFAPAALKAISDFVSER